MQQFIVDGKYSEIFDLEESDLVKLLNADPDLRVEIFSEDSLAKAKKRIHKRASYPTLNGNKRKKSKRR